MKRGRRAMKWLATLGSCIVLVAWAASMFRYYGYVASFGGRQFVIQTIPNQFGIGVDPGMGMVTGFHVAKVDRLQMESWGIDHIRAGKTANFLYVAFWIPALILGGPATWLWIADRRYGNDRCSKCGYPVGTSKICTECGHPLKSE